MNLQATIAIQKIPRKIPQTNPTPPDKSDTTGQIFFQIRMHPTSPDHSDRLQPPHNPPVVGSILTGPTASNPLSRFNPRDVTLLRHASFSADFRPAIDFGDRSRRRTFFRRLLGHILGCEGKFWLGGVCAVE
jgi:hypothetical protein